MPRHECERVAGRVDKWKDPSLLVCNRRPGETSSGNARDDRSPKSLPFRNEAFGVIWSRPHSTPTCEAVRFVPDLERSKPGTYRARHMGGFICRRFRTAMRQVETID